ncbi:MAG: hypothetical protein U5K74_10885 [Gemmatimonadaceae bacterium]|nr:hypothetical protein [Gemmatimonadaceae bacterium]
MRETEQPRLLDHGEGERQQQATADVTERVSRRRHPIDLALVCNVWQQRLIERHAPGRAGEREDERDRREHHVAALHEEHRRRRSGPEEHERDQEPLLRRLEVGQRAEDRRQNGDEHGTNRVDVAPPRRGPIGIHVGCGHLHEEDRKDCRHDDRLHARDAEVVHRPGAQFRPVEAKGAQPPRGGTSGTGRVRRRDNGHEASVFEEWVAPATQTVIGRRSGGSALLENPPTLCFSACHRMVPIAPVA